jgi:hypothetical protein
MAYGREKYSDAVDLLYPIRYKLVRIGGSDAQRDIFNQLLIVAAMKSNNERHRKMVEHLIIERQSLKGTSPLTDRLSIKLSKS